MSVPDIVRTIAKNVRQTVTNPSELREKAKDLPLNVLQTALTGVGQALMLGDRIRTGIKRLLRDDDATPETTTAGDARAGGTSATGPAGSGPAAASPAEELKDKPARREPVIFAPRPSQATDSLNGAAPKATATAPAPATAPPVRPAPAAGETTPAGAGKPGATEAAPAASEPAAPAEPKAVPAAPSASEAAAPAAPAAPKAGPVTAKTSAPEAKKAPATGAAGPAEPIPGYSELSLASLRARLRGKSADQVRALIEYEKSTSARDEVVQMYAKRLAKLEAGG